MPPLSRRASTRGPEEGPEHEVNPGAKTHHDYLQYRMNSLDGYHNILLPPVSIILTT